MGKHIIDDALSSCIWKTLITLNRWKAEFRNQKVVERQLSGTEPDANGKVIRTKQWKINDVSDQITKLFQIYLAKWIRSQKI